MEEEKQETGTPLWLWRLRPIQHQTPLGQWLTWPTPELSLVQLSPLHLPSRSTTMFIVVMLMMMMMVAIMAVGDDGTRLLTSNWSRCRAHHSSRKVASFVVGVILFSLITMLVLLFDSLTSKKPRFHSITVKKKKKKTSVAWCRLTGGIVSPKMSFGLSCAVPP